MPPPIRPNVLRMRPYSPGKPISDVRREHDVDPIIKLASNENPLGPSPRAVEAARTAAAQMHLYPDGAAFELRQTLSAKFGVSEDRLILGSGSDELIGLIGLVLLGHPDDELLMGDPSFVRYEAAAHLAPCRLVRVPLDGDYRHDLPAMARALTDRTRLVFIANPNNPTGTIVTRPELEAFLADVPDTALVVLDEAYFEFAQDAPGYPSSLDYLDRNVVGLRTFSKAYGLAGLRVGYGFAPAWLADAISRIRPPFNVNSIGQAAAVAALDDPEHVRKTVDLNRRGMRRIAEALREQGARVWEGWGNFVWADLGRPAVPVFHALVARGIIIRSGEIFGCPTCVRITIGTEEEVEAFVEAFESVMREPAVR